MLLLSEILVSETKEVGESIVRDLIEKSQLVFRQDTSKISLGHPWSAPRVPEGKP
jgi:hypothetical protein